MVMDAVMITSFFILHKFVQFSKKPEF